MAIRDRGTVRAAGTGCEVTPTVAFPPPAANDLGRYEATGKRADRWLYRVPTLRNVAITGPWHAQRHTGGSRGGYRLHNSGGFPTRAGSAHPALGLDAGQKSDLVAFLKA